MSMCAFVFVCLCVSHRCCLCICAWGWVSVCVLLCACVSLFYCEIVSVFFRVCEFSCCMLREYVFVQLGTRFLCVRVCRVSVFTCVYMYFCVSLPTCLCVCFEYKNVGVYALVCLL